MAGGAAMIHASPAQHPATTRRLPPGRTRGPRETRMAAASQHPRPRSPEHESFMQLTVVSGALTECGNEATLVF